MSADRKELTANSLLLNLFLEMIMRKIFAFLWQIHIQRPNSTCIHWKGIVRGRPKRDKNCSMMGKVLGGGTHRDRRLNNCWKGQLELHRISLCRRSLKWQVQRLTSGVIGFKDKSSEKFYKWLPSSIKEHGTTTAKWLLKNIFFLF